jgi:hypothetical protein
VYPTRIFRPIAAIAMIPIVLRIYMLYGLAKTGTTTNSTIKKRRRHALPKSVSKMDSSSR